MKKLVLGYLLLAAGIAGAACVGPYCYDDTGATVTTKLTINGAVVNGSGMGLLSATTTQVAALVPAAAGQLIYCSNCTGVAGSGPVCIATGTVVGAYGLLDSTATRCN